MDIVKIAKQLGFADAAVIDVKEIRFEREFRMYCEQNLCGKYGANYTCPPHCGGEQEMRQKVLQHAHALVVRSLHQEVKYSDNSAVRGAQIKHNNDMLALVKQLKKGGLAPLTVGASDCTLCEKCLWDKEKACPHEEDRFSCMSAYCMNVADLAQKCGIDYTYNEGVLSLFGMICF